MESVGKKCMFCNSSKNLVAPSLYNSDWICQKCQGGNLNTIIKQRREEGEDCRKAYICVNCNKVVELSEPKVCNCPNPSFILALYTS